MKRTHLALCTAVGLICSGMASAERRPGWEFGADVIYQDAKDIDFGGGSSVALDDDIGLSLTYGYRFNKRLDLHFNLDWNVVDYKTTVASATTGLQGFTADGDIESFTPRVSLNFNILEGDFTPYLTGGIGWAFIDTDIPDSPPYQACWWDPWWGYYCGVYQNTRSFDEFAYHLGVGARWDVSSVISLRLAYEKRWLDLSEATTTPDFDQIKFGVFARY